MCWALCSCRNTGGIKLHKTACVGETVSLLKTVNQLKKEDGLNAKNIITRHRNAGHRITGYKIAGHRIAGYRIAGHKIAGHKITVYKNVYRKE